MSGNCFRCKLSFQVTFRKESVSSAVVVNVPSLRQRINLLWRMGDCTGVEENSLSAFGAPFFLPPLFQFAYFMYLTAGPINQICNKWGNAYFFWSFSLYILFCTRVEIFPPIYFKGCVKWIRQYYRYVISFVNVWNFNIPSIFFAELALSS